VWCGQPPEGVSLIAPCCLFAAAIIACIITALGALVSRANVHEPIEARRALIIGFIAGALIAGVHIYRDSAALALLALAAALAAHAALIAILAAADFAGAQRAPVAWLQGEQR
jgi:hypothetical protein